MLVVGLYLTGCDRAWSDTWNDASADPVNLKDLLVADPLSPHFDWSVEQVLAEANSILGGGAGSPSRVNSVVSAINETLVDGEIDLGFLALP